MGSVLFKCEGCGDVLDPNEPAVLYNRRVEVRSGGSIDPTGARQEPALTHIEHPLARPWREVRRGTLSDLKP